MLKPACAFLLTDRNGLEATVLSGAKVITVTDADPQLAYQYPNTLNASILLPPYESVSAELDGNKAMAEAVYLSYLNSKEPDTFLSAIFTALVKGISIGIYIPAEDLEMSFAGTLLGFLYNAYGLSVMTPAIPFAYNNLFDTRNISKMYLYDLIGPGDLFELYPEGAPIEPSIINKLIFDINPVLDDYTFENYMKYFNAFLKRVKAAHNRMLISPIERDNGG